MNAEQIAKLKELARKAQIDGWPFYGVAYQKAASPGVVLNLIALAERTTSPVSQMTDIPAPPEMETLTDMERLLSPPADWDADYTSIWQKLQVAERNKMQWRTYALGLHAILTKAAAAPQAQAPAVGSGMWSLIDEYARAKAVYEYSTDRDEAERQRKERDAAREALQAALAAQPQPVAEQGELLPLPVDLDYLIEYIAQPAVREALRNHISAYARAAIAAIQQPQDERSTAAEAKLEAIRQGVECSHETLECLGDIFSNTERPDKITVRIDDVTNSLHVHYEDLDEEWLREVKEAIGSSPPKADESGLPG